MDTLRLRWTGRVGRPGRAGTRDTIRDEGRQAPERHELRPEHLPG
jgi:hypothetical protein